MVVLLALVLPPIFDFLEDFQEVHHIVVLLVQTPSHLPFASSPSLVMRLLTAARWVLSPAIFIGLSNAIIFDVSCAREQHIQC